MIEVIAFAGTLTDAGEHRKTAVLLGDVVDELEHVHGLAHAGAAEQPDLAALGKGHQ
jgi:peptide chain release factor 1